MTLAVTVANKFALLFLIVNLIYSMSLMYIGKWIKDPQLSPVSQLWDLQVVARSEFSAAHATFITLPSMCVLNITILHTVFHLFGLVDSSLTGLHIRII